MLNPDHSPLRLIAFLVVALMECASPAQAACDFAPVKQQIDTVLDKDATKGAKFRKEVSEGADSVTMIEKLVSADMADKIDICRFEVGEYLTKRGFPPFH